MTFNNDAAGLFEVVDWDSNVVASCEWQDDYYTTHHDFVVLPNGNILANAWKAFPISECKEAGMDKQHMKKFKKQGKGPPGTCTVDGAVELKFVDGQKDCELVWEWWDKDHWAKPSENNFDDPSENAELISFND